MTRIVAITVPKWGIEMQEGTFVDWRAAIGERVARGDEIADMETEKIVNALEAPADGTLRRQLAAEGDTFNVGALIGVLAETDVSDAEIDAFIAEFTPAEVSFEPAADTASAESDTAPAPTVSEAHISVPVRRLADRLGVDVAAIRGTGRNGRISREDVERAAEQSGQGNTRAPGSAEFEAVPMSPIRLNIAKRLVQSKREVPHFYLTIDLRLDRLLERRAELTTSGDRVSVNDLLVHSVARALIDVPQLNARLIDNEIRRFRAANVAVAVATDDGLAVPVVRDAEQKTVATIAAESRELAARARQGALTGDDIARASFTVSNLGMHGIKHFTAVINPPQVAILAIGAAEPRVIASDEGVITATLCNVTLSCDHRAVDGADGARFLAALRSRVESTEVGE